MCVCVCVCAFGMSATEFSNIVVKSLLARNRVVLTDTCKHMPPDRFDVCEGSLVWGHTKHLLRSIFRGSGTHWILKFSGVLFDVVEGPLYS